VSSKLPRAIAAHPPIGDTYIDLEPREVWRHFSALNGIPRPSGQEESVRAYLRSIAEARGAPWRSDDYGNTVVRLPAAGGAHGDAPTVAVQSHLDMVCEGEPGVRYEPATDPIVPRRVDDSIYASGTTLGADDGIGVAMSLALLTTPGLRHGPLELLFTVEEERGLRGALNLDPDLLRASVLINLDSEDSSQLIIGSAGAQDSVIRVPITYEDTPTGNWVGRRLTISGLRGGHSGLDIAKPRANAIKLLTHTLSAIATAGIPLRLLSLSGGSVRNAIPHQAHADVALPADMCEPFTQTTGQLADELTRIWMGDEPTLSLDAQNQPVPRAILTPSAGRSIIELLEGIPHGALTTDAASGGVRASCNLAHISIEEGQAVILVSSRSLVNEDMDDIQAVLGKLAMEFGAKAEMASRYSAWTPRRSDGVLLPIVVERYREVHGQPPKIETVHAGLECGTIVAKIPTMEAISFGPLICDAHTTREHLTASTVLPTWKLLTGTLDTLASGWD
jgi:dipeptidase D